MLSVTMRSAAAQALRACARGLPTKPSVASRAVHAGRSFLVAPRGYATATAKKTTAAAKKPAAKKTTAAKKKTVKKTATKAKAKAKKPVKKAKKAAAKPKKAAAKKRVISPERQKLLLKRALRKAAMLNQEPKTLPSQPWLVFVSGAIKKDTTIGGPATLGPKMSSFAAEFRNLSPAERQVIDQKAAENKAINAANYKAWVESHTVAEIDAANKARGRLSREFGVNVKHLKITDERMPKRPATTGWSYYIKAKHPPNATDLGQMAKNLAQEWKAMSDNEKKPYLDLAAAETAKWQKEKEKALS